MKKELTYNLSPSAFYRMNRPEVFSDSVVESEVILQREHLSFELHNISKNQKHDDFETLCRRLAETLIAPNLIPQVGPTGGGDGKTDSETYPVSKTISERWFIPENGWDNDEKWAFAFSAKKDWKSKVKRDVKKIIDTGRGYNKVFFMTNQTPSSKKKKEAQDLLIKENGIDIRFIPAEVNKYKGTMVPYFQNSILKNSLFVCNAWEVGIHDLERVVINKYDKPIIPDHLNKDEVPFFSILNENKNN